MGQTLARVNSNRSCKNTAAIHPCSSSWPATSRHPNGTVEQFGFTCGYWVNQRLTADGYRDIFLAPAWAANKLDILNSIKKELERRNSYQGIHYIKDEK